MNIKVNGEARTFESELNVTELLKNEAIEMPEMVSVEVNGEIIDREDFDTTVVRENDEVEFLYFMGGGAFGI
ncbi:sulfur carrier protein [Natranaerovirga hydrolytica]|uniref:Sulfur carrier protein n=1 Tax=Natranaerovirga hydrolytica TaxID=680378 RepID=A0A4R1MIL1_9FIRM|nr:sulfur carrier protein ThiS [Natranaerovirga hydrolytica]TCK92486.1 sulfur carrier protein [Natranaerovirga hydrolytica]